jgi:hypothetical protein
MAKKRNNSRKTKAEQDARSLRLVKLADYRSRGRPLTEYSRDVCMKPGIEPESAYRTALRDQAEFLRRQREMTDEAINIDALAQADRINDMFLETLEMRGRLERSRASLTADKQLALALAIVSQDIRIMERQAALLGLDAPKKTESKNLNVTVNTQIQYQFLERLSGREHALPDIWEFIESIPRERATIADAFPPKQLEAHNDESSS